MRSIMVALIVVVACLYSALVAADGNDMTATIEKGIEHTKERIAALHQEWEISNYPNFLKSCFMHKSSWETMKYKYLEKLLLAITTSKKQSFVASFTGSSVTAGHDSHFNFSTPVVVGQLMKSSFEMMNLHFESRNVALGNNPCVPYDVCVKSFAGLDADLVHWEQNYFCDGKGIMETFIRQAMTIPTKPIVVFSESNTGHWGSDKCVKGPHKVTPEEGKLLNMTPLELVSDANKDEYHRAWGFVAGVSKNYHGAAIQTFMHEKHTDYACLGPYIKTWMEGAASWHPSVIGHRLRASHHAYFWLLVYLDALEELKKVLSHRSADAALKDCQHHLQSLYQPLNPEPKHKSPFPDNMTCHTDYQPRSIQGESSLKRLVLSGLSSEDPVESFKDAGDGWHFIIYENLVDHNLVVRSQKQGYLDYKYLLFTGENAKPLSLKLQIERPGAVFICQTPGIWGSLPKGFDKLWEAELELYITPNTKGEKGFVFDAAKAQKQKLVYDKELDLCLQVETSDGRTDHPAGEHVLTLVPSSKHKIIFAWLLHT